MKYLIEFSSVIIEKILHLDYFSLLTIHEIVLTHAKVGE